MSGCKLDEAGAGVSLEQQVAEGRRRKQRSDCKVTDVQIYDAIVSNMGVVTYAAVALGILRPTLYRRIERAPQLCACLNAARTVIVRLAWDQLCKALDANARWAILFVVSRMHGFPMPRSGSSGSSSAETAPDKRKKATELVPQPEVADASTRRLVRALENGEPWAIKYCVSHLDPNGECGINQVRGRRNYSEEELKEPVSEEDEELQKVIDAKGAREFEQATRSIQQRHAVLMGRVQPPPAPPVVELGPRTDAPFQPTHQPADVSPRFGDTVSTDRANEPDAGAFRLMAEQEPHPPVAPPLVRPGSRHVAESLRDSNPAPKGLDDMDNISVSLDGGVSPQEGEGRAASPHHRASVNLSEQSAQSHGQVQSQRDSWHVASVPSRAARHNTSSNRWLRNT